MSSRLQREIKQAKPFGSLRQEVLLQMARTTAILVHAWEQALRVHGITLTQYNVLRILRGAGSEGLCRHEVASRLITQVPDVSRLLDRMMKAGLVTRTRDVGDRRLVNACITPQGLSLLEQLDAPSHTLVDNQLAHMSDVELRVLIELLETARSPLPQQA
jgi:DNA-binding MarR family transcriptional regulator